MHFLVSTHVGYDVSQNSQHLHHLYICVITCPGVHWCPMMSCAWSVVTAVSHMTPTHQYININVLRHQYININVVEIPSSRHWGLRLLKIKIVFVCKLYETWTYLIVIGIRSIWVCRRISRTKTTNFIFYSPLSWLFLLLLSGFSPLVFTSIDIFIMRLLCTIFIIFQLICQVFSANSNLSLSGNYKCADVYCINLGTHFRPKIS